MDYDEFLSHPKSLIISPAGYGKTYALSECIRYSIDKSLILTHTHAGVSSIKAKLKMLLVDSVKFHVETISSFSQKYTKAFYTGRDVPEQDSGNDYHDFMLTKARELCSSTLIKEILTNTYSGVFVDEYQDCTKEQHELVMELGSVLPVRVFGDSLQGIFDFNNQELVDFENDLTEFYEAPSLLVPYRWNNVGKDDLGRSLHDIRQSLINRELINLNDYAEQIDVLIAPVLEKYIPRTEYFRKINEVRNNKSLLVIYPISANKAPRIKFAKTFKGISSIESLDDRDFYNVAKACDNLDMTNILLSIRTIAYLIFDKSGLDTWFNDTGFKVKRDPAMKHLSNNVLQQTSSLGSIHEIGNVLDLIKQLPEVNCTRQEILTAILSALDIARSSNTSVFDAMKEQRNIIRRQGRAVYGRHIGTTLLTKGLEFDTVLVLDAHLFTCPKNLYVALTRCCKHLIVVSEQSVLSPYNK